VLTVNCFCLKHTQATTFMSVINVYTNLYCNFVSTYMAFHCGVFLLRAYAVDIKIQYGFCYKLIVYFINLLLYYWYSLEFTTNNCFQEPVYPVSFVRLILLKFCCSVYGFCAALIIAARRIMLANLWCEVSRCMRVKKVSNSKSDFQFI